MCGRYTHKLTWPEIVELYGLTEPAGPPPALKPRYNIAPTQLAPVLRQAKNGRELALLRWGLVPGWAKDPSIGNRLINARSETAAQKPSFRAAMRSRRCLVLASGFYEWQKAGKAKQPWWIGMAGGAPFAMAGLWESWRDPAVGDRLETFTILTTEANAMLAPIHQRMPVIVDRADHDAWLTGPSFAQLLRAHPVAGMAAHPVSSWVNSPAHDDPRCEEPVALPAAV
jgi:putative SOS response-associated peptidase YedK